MKVVRKISNCSKIIFSFVGQLKYSNKNKNKVRKEFELFEKKNEGFDDKIRLVFLPDLGIF